MAKRKVCYSGIGGQAVLEGIMMKSKDACAVAVRRNDGKIEVKTIPQPASDNKGIRNVPFIRGVFRFIESLTLGMKALNISAEYFAEEEDEETKLDKAMDKGFGEAAEKVMSTASVVVSMALALCLFMVLPYFLAHFLSKVVAGEDLLALLEGLIRLAIFLLYVLWVSMVKDIRRVFMYHGAEHKCINCLEHGWVLNVANVKKSSRYHKRCGTSFLLFVMLVSMVLFFFIRVDQPVLRILLRILLIPVIAGISYEIIALAGKTEFFLVRMLSAPGTWLQRMTTKEPDEKMIEVAIAAVEKVFDWKAFLKESFDYDVEEAAEAAIVMENLPEEEDLTGEADEAIEDAAEADAEAEAEVSDDNTTDVME